MDEHDSGNLPPPLPSPAIRIPALSQLLFVCAPLTSAILFCAGVYIANCSAGSRFGDECTFCAGWCLVGLAFFVGPLLMGLGLVIRLLAKIADNHNRK